ncbi:hypothetical protein Vadar_030571 [Vaccinium darrowii]|uniref:Uncharacterized protein n=1 Tax=Vaccinium darrowii TaxID=229202 RepID=A0ACB7XUH6_9ERIC|nr:hypothetical protein Vadar_030571 [Vaccinium darrowii]
MADAAEKPSINGRRLISQLKTLFSLPKTKRTYGFCYGLVFAFVAVTMFLAFTPSSNRGVSLLLPNFSPSVLKKQGSENLVEKLTDCDLFDGEWVRDESYPLYEPGSCSIIDEQFNCFVNGRPDNDYYKLKWKPIGCSLPRNSVKNQSNVYEANGRHNFRAEASSSFVFKDYGCTIELFVSPFLVQEWETLDKNGSKKETLRLDMISKLADEYRSADILIFNTGHWWTHEKTSKGENYYQEGSHVYTKLNVLEAFRRALTTWGRWVDANIDPMKTMVLFRGYSPSHFSGGQWNSGGQCHQDKFIKNETDLSLYLPKLEVLDRVFRGMKTPVSYLNITGMTDYRLDGHPSIYRKQTLSEEERKTPLMVQDCSHWCLPGVPDSWNELLYAELLRKQENTRRNVGN